ncbi:MAG: hypothetical protein LQ349_009500 [Xanthoria aureola]|nr:MAG: hypothetical protein LQ349_009500 [Xanthoria aureola]
MASHSLALAKASLAAGLMRSEPIGVSKTDIAEFHRLLDALLLQCSATNIQLCKEWLLQITAPSADKTKAVGKYLVALAAPISSTVEIVGAGQAKKQKISSRRRQLHILYLLHDFLHHVRFHGARLADGTGVIRTLEPYVTQLVTLAATYESNRYSRHLGRLNDLVNIWGESNYFPSTVVAVLRDTITNATDGSMSVAHNTEPPKSAIGTAGNGIGQTQKDAPYIMPPSHGDASVPFYDLPAGNLLPCIIPNSLTPISPQMVKPLQFRAGPADEELARAVKVFLQDIDVLYGYRLPGQNHDESDIDQLGQPTALVNTPEDNPANEGYYGWSKAFCEKMKLRSGNDQRASWPPQLEVGEHSRKRRKRSSSSSGRSLSQSSATSRSRSRGKGTGHPWRPKSDSRSRSQSRWQHSRMGEIRRSSPSAGASSPRSRSRSYSPPGVAALQSGDGRLDDDATPELARGQFPQFAPLPSAFLQQSFLNSSQTPIPPPPPPNYTGPWPPPPPPSLSAPVFTSKKPAQTTAPPPTHASNQPMSSPSLHFPSHESNLGSAQTFHGQAFNNFPSQAHQGSTDYPDGQPGRQQASQAGGAQGRGARW